MNQLQITPLTHIQEITKGTDLAAEIIHSMHKQNLSLAEGDIIVVTQKIVSKAEGATVDLTTLTPSPFAKTLAKTGKKSAAYYEVVLRQTKRIVKADHGIVICETHHGFVCANAGVDESNVEGQQIVTLLPVDPDASAQKILQTLQKATKIKKLAIIISDTWGRTWREGQTNMAIGIAGIQPLLSYEGKKDPYGYHLQATIIAIADELASAAELVMNKTDNVPAAIIRGYNFQTGKTSIQSLLRDPKTDLFR